MEYTCDYCKRTFLEGWDKDEAVEELHQTFGEFALEQCHIVCDDCYKEYMESEVTN